ncbi:MFS transporter, MHS family, proline/betaine transporter [Fictibacillus enclensis]|uniref:Putative proline/betaine transporter n=1 Tax=Fictibacillus enclensis TaxID=1017270 RepID=A0A0V8JBB4_9BACL|nr:MFS transporter [Fictibacillus enclensis]KSU84415.1 MFS transporter [Fictibacillus enclensis]SCB79053.1 MFS transporter, MHS family, proline/betaine transporter [Fictibacillus enclensis]
MERGQINKLTKEDITVVDTKIAKKSIFGTSLGNAMEWFDFGIYSYLAVTIGKVFFPEIDPSAQLIYAFATFAVAFIARPIGGLVFGMLGDRLGRKKVLAITLIMMAVATLSIGLIPGYATIGAAAPVLLLAARLVQGFSTGGEYAGAMTFIAESTPDKKRSFMSSFLEVGTLVGFIAGSGLVTLLTFLLGSETMLAWGWRIPFFIAAPLGMIGLYFRSHLEETPAFKEMKETTKERKDQASLKKIFTEHWRSLLICIGVVFFYNTINYMILTYMPSYLSEQIGFGEMKGLVLILFVMIAMIPCVLLMGRWADRIGRNRLIITGLVGTIVLSIPAFYLMDTGSSVAAFIGLLVLSCLFTAFQGTLPAALPSLFFTEVRYGSLALTYNVSTSIFGGTTPLVVAWLVKATGINMLPAYFLIGVCVIGLFVVTLFVKETGGRSLRGSKPTVEHESEAAELDSQSAFWWKEEVAKRQERAGITPGLLGSQQKNVSKIQ